MDNKTTLWYVIWDQVGSVSGRKTRRGKTIERKREKETQFMYWIGSYCSIVLISNVSRIPCRYEK